MHLSAFRILWLLGALRPLAAMAVHYGQTALDTKTNTYHLKSLIWVSDKAGMQLRVSITLWLLMALREKRVKKGKLFPQNRNTLHLESLIWVSVKAENASQSITNPFGLWGTCPHLAPMAVLHRPTAPCTNGILTLTPYFLKYTISFSIKDSRQVDFLSFFVLPCSDEKKN